MIDTFLHKVNRFFESEQYQDAYDLCQKELNKFVGKEDGLSQEENHYIATIYSVLAQILEPQNALQCLNAAIDFVPNNAELYLQRGAVKESLGDIQGAIDDYSIILEHIQSIEAYAARGNAQVNIGNIDGALNDFKSIMQLDPNDVEAKKAYVHLKAHQSGKDLEYIKCTLKTGEKVIQFVVDGEIINIPADAYPLS